MKAKYVISIYLFLLLLGLFPAGVATSDTAIKVTPIPTVCFTVNQVHLMGIQRIVNIEPRKVSEWRKKIEGQCVNKQGLLDYADAITSELVSAGYLTSYLYYPQQTFLLGIVRAEIVSGTVSSLTYQNENGETQPLLYGFPVKVGDVLDLRRIEQGLYNLKNVSLLPYSINLLRDDQTKNTTRIVVIGEHQRAWQGVLSFQPSTISNALMIGNPLLRNDFFYFNVSRYLNDAERSHMKSIALLYSLPYHYWLFSASGSYQQHQMPITLYNIELPMQQRSQMLLLQAEYILNRTKNTITSLGIGNEIQKIDTFISEQPIQTQKRLANYIIGELSHQVNFWRGQATFTLQYKQGTDWFGTNSQQITGLDKPQIFQLSVSSLWERLPFYYQSEINVQLSRSKLDALLEQSSLIGTGGVSGFTGASNVFETNDHHLKLSNELRWHTPWQQIQFYASLGLGTTANDRATFWKDNLLAGGKVGIKGQLGSLSYHFFIEAPFWQVGEFTTGPANTGMELSLRY
ncbi:TPA: ShlB/FhaC/HecB family hemolysin secretion/activation protein [Providencia rettgeri]